MKLAKVASPSDVMSGMLNAVIGALVGVELWNSLEKFNPSLRE